MEKVDLVVWVVPTSKTTSDLSFELKLQTKSRKFFSCFIIDRILEKLRTVYPETDQDRP